MKIKSRAARVFIATLITACFTVAAAAQPPERERVPPAIAKIVKKIVKIFGITTNESQPQPPRP